MPEDTRSASLTAVIDKLRAERAMHEAAIERIDATFAQHGIGQASMSKPGRKPGGKPGGKPGRPKGATTKKTSKRSTKRKTRRRFAKTAEQFVLDLVTNAKQLTTREINARWKQAGRGGSADNALTNLIKSNKLQRQNIEGQRGSMYMPA